MMQEAPVRPVLTEEERLASARRSVRDVERFAYRIVSQSDERDEHEARTILRLTIGLRRKLDLWRTNGE